MSFIAALAIAAVAGFIALSYEILWVRAFEYLLAASPEAFGLLLGFYLFGVALGSLVSMALCRDSDGSDPRKLRLVAAFVLVSGILSYLTIPAFAHLASHARWLPQVILVALAAGSLGTVLPLVSHFGIPPDDRAGSRLSQVYLANIVGSASGSLITGLVLLDVATLRQISVGLLALSALLTLALFAVSQLSRPRFGLALTAVAAVVVAGGVLSPVVFDQVYERLLYRDRFTKDVRYAEVIENRSGVIAVTHDGIVLGGGAYDGHLNTVLRDNHNLIERAYAAGMMKPRPREVLLVGLGSGSWAQILAHIPGVEKLTVVEINPGYVDIIRRHPAVSGILTTPKIEIHIDDARRFLSREVDRRFDLIVVNTTFHWRAHTTNLLSQEFLTLCRARLHPGGVHYFNTTWSDDAMKTALSVFRYTLRFDSFVAGSDAPLSFDEETWRRYLTDFEIEGKHALDLTLEADRTELERLVAKAQNNVETHESLVTHTSWATVITDDNMINEWGAWNRAPPGFERLTKAHGGRFRFSD